MEKITNKFSSPGGLKPWSSLLISVLLMVLVAVQPSCASGPKIVDFPEGTSSFEELEKTRLDLVRAGDNQVDVLSPSSYGQSLRAYKAAQESQKEAKSTKVVLHKLAEARAYLSQANESAKLVHNKLDSVAEARKAAMNANAPKIMEKDFHDVDDVLVKATSRAELDNDFREIEKSQSTLLTKYLDLELAAIQHSSLHDVRAATALAIQEGAKEHAPASLVATEKKIQAAELYVRSNRHDNSRINALVDEATASAQHLLKITRESKLKKTMSPEEIALQMEKKDEAVTQQRAAVAASEDERRELYSEHDFNKRFEDARAKFNEQEAEVFRQGDKLVIRLRSLNFKTAKATIEGKDFPLLEKVRSAVVDSGATRVIVEGHTDATGNKAQNQKLSQERAHAVAEFLMASNAIDRSHLVAVGLGSEKPIASHKTVQGRAQNRRVDIVIVPQKN